MELSIALGRLEQEKTEYTIKEFGAKANGVDQLAYLQRAIDTVSAQGGGTITFPKKHVYSFRGVLKVKDNVELFNPRFRFIHQTSQVVMTGENPTMTNYVIDAGTFNNSAAGVVELVESKRALLRGGLIKGRGEIKAIMCKTQQQDTRIENCEVNGLGWGILFNDGASEQDRTNEDGTVVRYRVFGGKDYSNVPLGDGLSIDNFRHSPDNDKYGDGIEINCPDFGIKRVSVTRCTINAANAGSMSESRGIGIGFANCYYVTVSDCQVSNATLDAYHFEKGAYHTVTNCIGWESSRALSIAHTVSTKVTKSIFHNCGTWMVSYNDRKNNQTNIPYQQMYDLQIEGNTFHGTLASAVGTGYGLLLGNAKAVRIQGNVFREFAGSTAAGLIQFSNTNFGNVTDSIIADNLFDKGDSAVSPVAVVSMNGKDAINNWYRGDNRILGYSAISVNIDTTRNRAELRVRRNVTLPNDSTPTNLYLIGAHDEGPLEPTSYSAPKEGKTFKSLTTGQHYLATATAWVAQPQTKA